MSLSISATGQDEFVLSRDGSVWQVGEGDFTYCDGPNGPAYVRNAQATYDSESSVDASYLLKLRADQSVEILTVDGNGCSWKRGNLQFTWEGNWK